MAKPPPSTLDQVVSLCKRRGFVYPCGEIYGGTRSAWDYGPLGVELKENIKRQWWKSMVTAREDVVGLDSSVILPTKTWEASGHLSTFSDPLTECQSCHKRFREDHLQEEYAERKGIVENLLFLAGSAINSIKNERGQADPVLGTRAMMQALEVHRGGQLAEVSAEDHLDALAGLARRDGLDALLVALRQRYPGRVA